MCTLKPENWEGFQTDLLLRDSKKKCREPTLQGRTHATCYCRLCHRILLKSFLGKEMAEKPVSDCSVGICHAYNYVMKMP